MDFLLAPSDQKARLSGADWKTFELNSNYTLYLQGPRQKLIEHSAGGRIFLLGDCLNPELLSDVNLNDVSNWITRLKGNFYLIIDQPEGIRLVNSFFSLLPIYHTGNRGFFGSSHGPIQDLIKQEKALSTDKKFLIHQLLFNFQLGDRTPFEEIKLLPVFSWVQLDDSGNKFHSYFHIEEFLVKKPDSWRKSIDSLSDLFIDISSQYIPEKNSVISFTGGFDGRCLVSVALHDQKQFTAFSYGKLENDDVYIPKANCEELQLPYEWLDLSSKEYIEANYQKSSNQYTRHSNYQNGLLYAHVNYSAEKLSTKTHTLLSGLCGSELLRATHSAGAVYSAAALQLFIAADKASYSQWVKQCNAFEYLNQEEYATHIESVIQEAWEFKEAMPSHLSIGEKLYVFTCHEVFRKFFGAWLADQMKYLNVRTPYLDFDFFKALQKTSLSGAYSDFMTKNPLKRFKGQLLYAAVIKKTNRTIYRQKTGKGYAPKALGTWYMRPLLLLPFLTKRIKRNITQENIDNLSIISAVLHTLRQKKYQDSDRPGININKLIEDAHQLKPDMNERKRDLILQMLSYLQWHSL